MHLGVCYCFFFSFLIQSLVNRVCGFLCCFSAPNIFQMQRIGYIPLQQTRAYEFSIPLPFSKLIIEYIYISREMNSSINSGFLRFSFKVNTQHIVRTFKFALKHTLFAPINVSLVARRTRFYSSLYF